MSGTLGIWTGILIIAGVIYFLIKQYETRFILISAGLLMCTLALKPMGAFEAFTKAMTNAGLVPVILSVMGFAAVMKITKCDAHLVNALVGTLSKVRMILIPATVIVTAFINISLSSAAGCAAAVGSVLIPLMISIGVHPAMAASAVMAGTFGSMLSPGLAHSVIIAEKMTENGTHADVMDVIAVHFTADIVAVLVAAVGLAIIAAVRGEARGYIPDASHQIPKMEKPNYALALIPILPVALLVISSMVSGKSAGESAKAFAEAVPFFKGLSVPAAMIIGSIIGIVATWTNPQEATKEFFTGMGSAYANVMGIIIAAGVFVAGMQAIGLVEAFIDVMKNSPSVAKLAAAIGPFALAIITGSGDAATMAFNNAVTPHAEQFGMTIANIGSIATLAGCLGRTMSPLAGAAIVCSGLAMINPLEISKRNALPMVAALIIITLMLG